MLNVRSVPRGDTRLDDLTARARVRDAAITRFGDEGFGVGLRAIAADAGTSVGLIAHHFRSKAGLRTACDEHVLAVIRDNKSEVTADPGATTMLAQLAAVEQYGPLVAYVLRTLQEGGARARDFVEHFAADARTYLAAGVAAGTIVPSRDEAARTRYLTQQSLGGLVLAWSIDPVRAGETVSDWFRRFADSIVAPGLEVMTEGLLADRSFLDAYLSSREPDPQHPRTEQP